MPQSETTQILIALVPVIISGLVAIVTSKESASLRAELAKSNARILVLEQILLDHGIPVPSIPDKL